MEPNNTNQNVNRNNPNHPSDNGAWDDEFRPRRRTSGTRVFWGVVFILAAAAIALNALGYIAIDGLKDGALFWVIALVVILILSIPHRVWFGIFFPLMGLFVIFAEPLGIDVKNISLWVCFFVALFLSIGFSILFSKRRRNRWHEEWADRGYERTYVYGTGSEHGSNAAESAYDSVVHIDTNFGNVIKYINSDSLERVEAECNFGALKLYLDNAKPVETGALIILDVNFGAAELFIPRTWTINNDLRRSLSGIDEKNVPAPSAERTARVTIAGEANFSSVSIIYI
jgi:hypothetical protein